MLKDTIHLQDIHVSCILGCYQEERTKLRDVYISLTLFTDISKPAETDKLEDTLDYDKLTSMVIELAEKSRFKLIEALAQAIADLCLKQEMIMRVQVDVTKPNPRPELKAATVSIERAKTF